jgi:nucleotide-binding universal stress UspA family protein
MRDSVRLEKEARMKIKPAAKKGNVVMEWQSGERPFSSMSLPEVQLRKILVPTDFSESSRKALHYAVSLAGQFGGEVLLLNVIEPVTPPPAAALVTNTVFDTDLADAVNRELSEWRNSIGAQARMKTVVRNGTPFREIVAAADEYDADLIIISTHGRTGLAHLFMGSTAERVVRHATCPVLVLREHKHDLVESEEKSVDTKKRWKGKHYVSNRIEEKRSRKSAAVLRR